MNWYSWNFTEFYREKWDSCEVVDTHSLKTRNILEKNTEACKLGIK